MPGAGFFLDIPNWAGQPSYSPHYKYIAHMQNVSGTVNADCAAAHRGDDAWMCFFAQYTLPHIKTELFMLNSLADTWQLSNIVQLPCLNDLSKCNATEMAAVHNLRTTMLSFMQPGLARPTTGAFLETCPTHGLSNLDNKFDGTLIHQHAMREVIGNWYFRRSSGPVQEIDGVFPSTESHCVV